MSELCLSSTSKIQLLFSLLKSDLFLFCSLILSNPIYFLYFIFFSPYLFKLLSFLSPLFITTFLLLLTLLTVSPTLIVEDKFSKESSTCSKVSFLVTACHAVVEGLRSKIDDHDDEELSCLEVFEVFKTVFDTPPIIHDEKGSQVEVLDPVVSLEAPVFACSNGALASKLEVEFSGECGAELPGKWAVMEEDKRLEAFLQQLDEFDGRVNTTTTPSVEEKKIEPAPPSTKANKVVEKQEEKSEVTNGSEAAAGNRKSENVVEFGSDKGRQQTTTRVKVNSQRVAVADANVDSIEENGLNVESSRALEYINLGSYGSMRRDKDWKRTLAGKLFEERHNAVGGGEGMDLLWEAYETESSKTKPKIDKKEKNKKKYEVKYHSKKEDDYEDNGGYESDGQLCCLQALKFSTGKMNMGMGRPSLVRITKAIKGIGWLHHVSSRHSKKVHNGDRF